MFNEDNNEIKAEWQRNYNADWQSAAEDESMIQVGSYKKIGEYQVSPYNFAQWFDNLEPEEFLKLWNDRENEGIIKSFVRYPGGNHEWLMAAALPELKCMGIPMELIKEYVTPTERCCFFMNDKLCFHGREGSGLMHSRLFQAIVSAAYGNSYAKGQCNDARVCLLDNLNAALFALWPEDIQDNQFHDKYEYDCFNETGNTFYKLVQCLQGNCQ